MATNSEDVTGFESHFAFGQNWANYATSVDSQQINEAIAGLRMLLGDYDLVGKRFLDIGCGSGIHSVAASCLGAAEVMAVDLDSESVASKSAQSLARGLCVTLFVMRLWAKGRSFRKHVDYYHKNHRGTDFYHDVHDWLGGYPYESISSDEVEELMRQVQMVRVRSFVKKGFTVGIFGSACNEYA